jgi:regulator of protease activity HflC (stomatin/prohibitin superfamily)
MGCIYSIPQDKVAVIEFCGKFDRLSHPGCLCLPVPCVCSYAGAVSMRVQQLNVRVESKSKDNVFVALTVAVQFMVLKERIYEAFYKLSSPANQINSFVFDAVRAQVPKLTLDEVFEEKNEIADHVREQLAAQMSEFGFKIIQALVIDLDPDDKVKNAMNEINANRRLRIAAQEKAEADKIMMVKRAEADAESKFLQGEGVARQRKAIVEGLRDSVHDFTERVGEIAPKDVLELVLVTQYFDTLKEVGLHSENNTLFIPHNPGSLNTLAKEIKEGFSGLSSSSQLRA